jgi:energy-coupling factor transport system ATP-binding protein
MISVERLTYTYPATDAPALAGVTFEIPQGQLVAVVGANGAGKTTLCYALAGYMPGFFRGQVEGAIQVAGHDVARTPLADLSGVIGLVFDNPFNQITGARFTVREEVAFGLENLAVPREEMETRVDDMLALTGLSELAHRSPFDLSGGQQQRLALASVMVMAPRVLILDEPTSQLDPKGTLDVFETLRRLATHSQTTVVLTEHKLEWVAAFAHRVLVLDHGRLAADGSTTDVLGSPQLSQFGLTPTRYTQAAREYAQRGWANPGLSIPVTLHQAEAYFEGRNPRG